MNNINKKYQIFVSSTFRDLIEERQAVLEAILELDHIPCGMEAFPANNSTPFEFIKTMIDDSDYYVLIIGGRYGSLNEEGISYTESEYDYALETGKPILCFIHSNLDELRVNKVETKSSAIKKLEKFKQKVSRHIHKDWTNKDDLKSHVLTSLSHAFRSNPMPGWVKLKDVNFLSNVEELQKKYSELQEKHIELKESYNELKEKYRELTENTPILTHYTKNLRDKDHSVRQEACKALGAMGEKAKEAVPELIAAILFDASPLVKVSAIEALRNIDTSSQEAVESFITSLKNKDTLVREAAAKALGGGISPASNSAIEALITALNDEELRVRVYSMESLILLDKSLYRHVIPVLQYALIEYDHELRAVAFDTVKHLDALPEEVLSLLIQVVYNEFELTGEKKSDDEGHEAYHLLTKQTIKTLAYFERKGQAITGAIISYYAPGKGIKSDFPELWLKEDASAKGKELIVSVLSNHWDNEDIKSQVIEFGPDIIPILQKQLQLNPVGKIWTVEPLIKLDPSLKADLVPYILAVTESTEFYAWKEIVYLLGNYDFDESSKHQVFVKAVLMDFKTVKDQFATHVQKPALDYLLPKLLKDTNQIPLIIQMINHCDHGNGLFYKVEDYILKAELKNKEVLETLWNNALEKIYHNREKMSIGIKILNVDLTFFPVIEKWFNKFKSNDQLELIKEALLMGWDLKNIVPILSNALSKSRDLKYAAVACLQEIGPAAIQSIPYLQKAKEATSDGDLKLKIEDAIRIIENN
jgi:hypothetical protein